MKILIDENIPKAVAAALRTIYPQRLHQFDHVYEIGIGGMKDPELFTYLRENGYDMIITEDKRQLEDHGQQILESGVHWAGYKSKKNLRGTLAFSVKTATVVAAMEFLIELCIEAGEQQIVRLNNVPFDRRQRVRILGRDYVTRVMKDGTYGLT